MARAAHIADGRQCKADHAARQRLAQLARKRVDGVHGAVVAAAGAYLLIIDNVGDERPDDHIEKAHAHAAHQHQADIGPHRAQTQRPHQQVRRGGNAHAHTAGLFFAEPFGQLCRKGRQRQHGQHAREPYKREHVRTVEIIFEQVHVHALAQQACQKQQQRGADDGCEGAVARQRLCQRGKALPFGLPGRRRLHTLTAQRIAKQIAGHGAHAVDNGDHREALRDNGLRAVRRGAEQKQRRRRGDDQVRQHGAHAAERGKRRALACVGAEHRRHGTVWDIDGGITDAAPENIGGEHVSHLARIGPAACKIKVHQHAGQRHGHAHAQDPRPEPAAAGRRKRIHQTAHAHVRERVHAARHHEQHAHQPCADAQHIRIKQCQIAARENKCEVVAEIPEQISQFIAEPERALILRLQCHMQTTPLSR